MTNEQFIADHFYGNLSAVTDFGAIADLNSFQSVPGDWIVLVADVEGSTKAIEAGNYKTVNMVGAATITAVLNIRGETELPYVFGGDGATILIPENLLEPARLALLGVQRLSEQKFGLKLRVGAVPLGDIRQRGLDVLVCKYELSPRNFLAMFGGGGLALADSLIKDAATTDTYIFRSQGEIEFPDLEGLSCRWDPLVPQNGQMLTLMVQTRTSDPRVHQETLVAILGALRRILNDDPRSAAPANPHSMRFRWPPRGLWLEAQTYARHGSTFMRYLGILIQSRIQYWCEKNDRKAGDYDAPEYRQELRANTDFRKFDDVLRMVLDVSDTQVAAIEDLLADAYKDGKIIFGTHLSNRALMTCLVFSLANSEHVHFIDGSDGGFAFAARAFKQRATQALSS